MTHWIPYALVRVVVCFIAGIILALFFPDAIPSQYRSTLLTGFVVFYVTLFFIHRLSGRRKFNPGVIALPAVVIAGYFNLITHIESRWEDHISNITDPVEFYEVRLDDFAHEKEKSWKQIGAVSRVRVAGQWREARGNILLYFSKEMFPMPFMYGDHLLVSGKFTLIPAPANPGEFDYQKFMSYRNVYHQHFLRDNVTDIKNAPSSTIMATALVLRSIADQKLKSLVEGEREKALASALVLGVVDALDNELMNAYAATGAMHVLAVSGLHVGILYWILLILLKPLKSYQWGKWITAVICLAALWGYACVTGLSPSVLRAVVMFSFVIIGFPLNFRTNIYNILAASAFCLLLYDPFMLVSVGFQLSYLAVLGIVYLQPLLYQLIEPQNRIVDETWKITCISLAAQLSTFMLGLLYFHQFPNYFLISNLFVIPLSFIILMTGLAALTFSFIAWLGSALGFCLMWLIKILNYLVFWVESWPFSLVENIYISAWQAVLLGMIVLIFCFYLEQRRLRYLFYASLLLVCFSGFSWIRLSSEVFGNRLTVYRVAGQTVFDFTENGSALTFSSTDSSSDKHRLDFNLKPNRLIHGVENAVAADEISMSRAIPGGEITVWKKNVLVRISERGFQLPARMNVDFLVLSKNSVKSLSNLNLGGCKPGWIIIDSSNSRAVANTLFGQAKAYPAYRIHSIWHQGAFEVKL